MKDGHAVLAALPTETDEVRRLGTLERVIQLLGRSHELPPVSFPLVELVADALSAHSVALRLVAGAPRGAHGYLWSGGESRPLSEQEGGLLGRTMWTGLDGSVVSVRDEPGLQDLVLEPWEQGAAVTVAAGGENGEPALAALAAFRDEPFLPEDSRFLGAVATLIGSAMERVRLEERLRGRLVEVVSALSSALDARDPYTRGHSDRVALIALTVLTELERATGRRYPPEYRQSILLGGLLHDVGKIGVPDHILLKQGKLTPEEYAVVREHPT